MSLYFIWLICELKKNWNKCVRLWYKDEFYNIFIPIIISSIYNDEFCVIFWPLERPGLPPRSVCWQRGGPHIFLTEPGAVGRGGQWTVNSPLLSLSTVRACLGTANWIDMNRQVADWQIIVLELIEVNNSDWKTQIHEIFQSFYCAENLLKNEWMDEDEFHWSKKFVWFRAGIGL